MNIVPSRTFDELGKHMRVRCISTCIDSVNYFQEKRRRWTVKEAVAKCNRIKSVDRPLWHVVYDAPEITIVSQHPGICVCSFFFPSRSAIAQVQLWSLSLRAAGRWAGREISRVIYNAVIRGRNETPVAYRRRIHACLPRFDSLIIHAF